MKIGIIKEGKIPVDHRAPLTPKQAKEVMDTFEGVAVGAAVVTGQGGKL